MLSKKTNFIKLLSKKLTKMIIANNMRINLSNLMINLNKISNKIQQHNKLFFNKKINKIKMKIKILI